MQINSIKILTSIFDEIKDLALKMFVGVIIFVPIDGALGLIFHYFFKQDRITPFFLSTKSFEWISFIYQKTNIYFTILILSLFLYALGKAIYILRQPLILDKIKNNYVLFISNKEEIKLFEELRTSVIRKLKTEKKFSALWEIGWEHIKNNDYFLYLILGKDYYSSDIQKRNQEANEISFLGSSIITLTFLTFFFYLLKLPAIYLLIYCLLLFGIYPILHITLNFTLEKLFSPKYSTVKSLINLIISGILILIVLSLPIFSNTEFLINLTIMIILCIILSVQVITVQIAANRYISRNKRLYLNYLTDKSNNKNQPSGISGEGFPK